MAKITPGNRVYLYQLLSRELGVNRQTLLPRAEEALVADGLAPADLGCADMRELCEQLPEFIKLTVFKKGYVYATVLACEEYDRALERTQDAGDKAAASGKPWKRKRGAKALKPVRPRHIEPPARKDEKDEKDGDAVVEAVVPDGTEAAGGAAPAEVAAHEGEPTSSVGEASEAAPEPDAAHAEEGPAEVAPSDAAPSGEEASGTGVDGPGAPVEPGHEPPISFTITYVPEAPSPDAIALPDVAPRFQSDLPRDFHADIRCSDEQLSLLYQVLPPNVDPLTVLEEDFRAARSTGALDGTRSNVSFALRYLQADGATPVRVTLRRSARPVAGKRWALTEVEAGAAEEVGLEGLSAAACGPWSAFAEAAPDGVDPLRALTSTVALGPWDEALSALAALAAPEPWGEGLAVLRDYLTMTVARIVSEGKVAVSPDGAAASFDTGLLTGDGAPIYALLSPLEGDIPWQLAEFSTAGAGEPALYLTALAEAAFDRSIPAPDFSGAALVMRCPRAATPAYDPVSDRTVLLVPDGGSALALLPTESGYERIATLSLSDGYACARVVSAELPAWLRG